MQRQPLETQFKQNRNRAAVRPTPSLASSKASLSELRVEDEAEVLRFLGRRPSHTFGMSGFIRANGLVSPLHRGKFYAYRDSRGQLEGVALIGHHILFETNSEAAIEAFAELAQACPIAFVLMAEHDKAERFSDFYTRKGKAIRVSCHERLLEQRWPVAAGQTVSQLRLATLDDLNLVAPAHAEIACQESGVNPLERDPEGFLARYARRIENGKTWVWIEDGRLIFKADIICDTPDVVYLEGIWVAEEERRKGLGQKCLAHLTRELLQRTKAVCLLVNEDFKEAQKVYQKAGFKFLSHYDTVYLQAQGESLSS